MEWEKIFSGKCFITDLGEEQQVESEGKSMALGQYAVWAPFQGNSHHQIVEVGENLQELMSKYEIPEDRVCVLVQQ
ncbi:MAG: hypothetical protein NC203_08495 [Firmicutes bacterium]|nr:hypothetical protein [[Eubacterium] siraeum]MCM1488390.1 hypothetical protein [Bacillota bacterium]